MLTTATILLRAALPVAAADTPYTATGWVIGVPLPGIWCTNALGQVGFRGNAHLARVVSTDARVTGLRTIYVDGAAQADGSSIIYGPVYHEVGTWDATGTNFTATGGMWENTYSGTMGTDGSLQLHIVGSGWGGTIDGLRLDETLTRAAGPNLDPTIPYLYTGTVKPPPVNTNTVVDNFDDNILTGWTWFGSGTSLPHLLETNHQFTVRGSWPRVVTHTYMDTWDYPALSKNWSVANNRTLECRVDLVSMSENATNLAALVLWSGSAQQSCIFFKGRDFIQVGKWIGGSVAVLFHENAVIKNTNVVLSLALTRMGTNVVLTARVLDKDNQEAVLYQRSVVDTPKVDPTLTSAELNALSGMKLNVVADNGAPLTSGTGVFLTAAQYTDGKQPELEVIYDNLELRTSEVPLVAIERTVRVSWPVSATINYSVEGAPNVQGPWLPVQDSVFPGFQQITVPANDIMQFFRLQQAP
jgi:hypothetical protein